jgi:hypothetical protein
VGEVRLGHHRPTVGGLDAVPASSFLSFLPLQFGEVSDHDPALVGVRFYPPPVVRQPLDGSRSVQWRASPPFGWLTS